MFHLEGDQLPQLLLVEDNPADVRMFRAALAEGSAQCEIKVATDGEQALAFLCAASGSSPDYRPDLIVLDVNLPKLSGHEVLQRIKQDRNLRTIPVLMLTSSNLPTDVQEAYRHGANSYFQKPATLENWLALGQTVSLYWLNLALLPLSPGFSRR